MSGRSGDKPAVKSLARHVFICTNERPDGHPRGSCKARGGEQLVQKFKEELAKAGVSGIRAQKAGCLDVCEWGAAAVVYPDNVWYGQIEPSDVAEIVQKHLAAGQPVDRLRIPGK